MTTTLLKAYIKVKEIEGDPESEIGLEVEMFGEESFEKSFEKFIKNYSAFIEELKNVENFHWINDSPSAARFEKITIESVTYENSN